MNYIKTDYPEFMRYCRDADILTVNYLAFYNEVICIEENENWEEILLATESKNQLVDFLLFHERDINQGVNDFGQLSRVFISKIGRPPTACKQTT